MLRSFFFFLIKKDTFDLTIVIKLNTNIIYYILVLYKSRHSFLKISTYLPSIHFYSPSHTLVSYLNTGRL